MPEKEAINLGPEEFASAFPFHFAFDQQLKIVAVGNTLTRKVDAVRVGAAFQDCFTISRPHQTTAALSSFSDPKTLFLFECHGSPLLLRGQIIQHSDERYLFLGSPWFSNTEDMIAAGLTIEDFATHDPVIDHLQLLQSQKMAFQDIKSFSDKLKKQKEKLSQANQELEHQYHTLQQTEQRLRQKEAEARKLALVAAGTDNAVIITDANGLTEWVNNGFTKQTGYQLSDIQGKKPGHLLQGEATDPATAKLMGKNIAEGKSFHVEIINYTKTQEQRWIEIECQPIRDADGNITNFIAIESDITARKQAEISLRKAKQAAEDANRLKSEFLATVSHEIRTPMNGVLGMSELLLDSKLDSKQLGILQTIRSSADSLLAVINDVLDISKIESGKLEVHKEHFSLRSLIDNVLGSVCERCAQKGVELNAIVHSDVVDSLYGDRSKLQQILINLIGNAAKFTEQGEVRLEVHETSRLNHRTNLEFTVRDTGIGFDPSEADKIFETFRQSDSGLARKHGGTGLGLSISKKLSEILDGSIRAEGQLNQGAKFTCRVPLTIPQPDEVPSAPLDAPLPVRVFLNSFSSSSGRSIAAYLDFLKVPYQQVQSSSEIPKLILTHSSEANSRWVHLRDESDEESADLSDKFETITLVSLGSDYRVRQNERVLIKPLRFLSIKNALQAIVDGTEMSSNRSQTTSTLTVPRYRNILVAEDNPINRQLIQELLYRLEIPCKFVKNGNEALDRLENEAFDCILMDCQMPELDGLETTREIRRREAKNHYSNREPTTIIAMTANALVGDREECLSAGMDDYLAKPIRFAEVRERLLASQDTQKKADDSKEATTSILTSIEETLRTLADEISTEAVIELTSEVLESEPQRLNHIVALWQNRDLAHLRMESHSFKSVCQTYGLTNTGVIAQQIETAAADDTTEGLEGLVDQLRTTFDSEAKILKNLVEKLKASEFSS